MKKRLLIFLLLLCVLLSACGKTNVNKPDDVTDKTGTINIEKAMAVTPAPDVSLLDGEWVFAYGETDGYEFTAEQEGIESGISINISDSTAKYYSKTEFTDEKFDAELEIIEEPVYEGCGNDEWKVKFNTYNSTFGEDEEFYATLIDENTLLLRHLFPFDGTQGVSHQTYTRK